MGYFLHVHGNEARQCSHPGGGAGGFAPGMARPDDEDVVVEVGVVVERFAHNAANLRYFRQTLPLVKVKNFPMPVVWPAGETVKSVNGVERCVKKEAPFRLAKAALQNFETPFLRV